MNIAVRITLPFILLFFTLKLSAQEEAVGLSIANLNKENPSLIISLGMANIRGGGNTIDTVSFNASAAGTSFGYLGKSTKNNSALTYGFYASIIPYGFKDTPINGHDAIIIYSHRSFQPTLRYSVLARSFLSGFLEIGSGIYNQKYIIKNREERNWLGFPTNIQKENSVGFNLYISPGVSVKIGRNLFLELSLQAAKGTKTSFGDVNSTITTENNEITISKMHLPFDFYGGKMSFCLKY